MTDQPNGINSGRGTLRERVGASEPPNALEERVRYTLEARRLVRRPHRAGPWLARAGLLAAGFLMGILSLNLARDGGSANVRAGEQYVLLLYGDPVDDTGSVHVAREREYGQWASSLAGGTRWVGGHELGDVIADIPTSASTPVRNDRLAGYFVIAAPTRERAAEVARSTPHLAYGGRVVLMAVEP